MPVAGFARTRGCGRPAFWRTRLRCPRFSIIYHLGSPATKRGRWRQGTFRTVACGAHRAPGWHFDTDRLPPSFATIHLVRDQHSNGGRADARAILLASRGDRVHDERACRSPEENPTHASRLLLSVFRST